MVFPRMHPRRAGTLFRLLILSAGTVIPCLGGARPAEASHFRYGHLTWRATGANTVDFTLTVAFRRSGFDGTAPDGFLAVGDLFEDEIGDDAEIEFGDGSDSGPLRFRAIAIDPASDFVVGRAVDTTTGRQSIPHTYASPNNNGAPWVADYEDCCRLRTLRNNANGSYRVLTRVDLAVNSASPVSALPVVIGVPQVGGRFVVPATDPGNRVRFRFSQSEEASSGAGFIQIPGATVDPVTGLYTVPPNLAVGLWSTQVTIEELNSGGFVIGQVAVDLLVNVGAATNNVPPAFVAPTPTAGTTFTVNVGQPLTFTVRGEDPDSQDPVTLNSTGAPPGAAQNPELPTAGSPASSVFTWTPGPADAGSYTITYTLSDSDGGFTLTSINIVVVSAPRSVRLVLSRGGKVVARTLLRRRPNGAFRGSFPRLRPGTYRAEAQGFGSDNGTGPVLVIATGSAVVTAGQRVILRISLASGSPVPLGN